MNTITNFHSQCTPLSWLNFFLWTTYTVDSLNNYGLIHSNGKRIAPEGFILISSFYSIWSVLISSFVRLVGITEAEYRIPYHRIASCNVRKYPKQGVYMVKQYIREVHWLLLSSLTEWNISVCRWVCLRSVHTSTYDLYRLINPIHFSMCAPVCVPRVERVGHVVCCLAPVTYARVHIAQRVCFTLSIMDISAQHMKLIGLQGRQTHSRDSLKQMIRRQLILVLVDIHYFECLVSSLDYWKLKTLFYLSDNSF